MRLGFAGVTELISAQAERYARERTTTYAGQLAQAAAWTRSNTPSPQMLSGLAEARLLEALIVVSGAQRLLEIGTFTGVTTLAMAAAMGPEGRIDAWKADYPDYYDAVLPKLAARGVIVADNLFRDGAALDSRVTDDGTVGIREFARRVQADERVHNVLLTVGDGVMLVWLAPES